MPERMTWPEIKQRYPNQWVGLTDVKWKNDSNIESAVVKYTDKTSTELGFMQVKDDNLISMFTTIYDDFMPLGAISI